MYTIHEHLENGVITISLRDGDTSFCSVSSSNSFCEALQLLANQLTYNITNDHMTLVSMNPTQIPEPLASVVRACIVRRRRHALQSAKTYHEALKVMK